MLVLLRKLRYMRIRQSKLPQEEQNLEKLYNNRLKSEASEYQPGELYEIRGRKFYPCNIVGDKVNIPRYALRQLSYIVDDDLNFLLAVEEQTRLKIVINLKYKFVNPVIDHRDVSVITLKIRGLNAASHDYVDKEGLQLRCNDLHVSQKIVSQLLVKRGLCRQAELSFISRLLTNSEKDLPQIDLL